MGLAKQVKVGNVTNLSEARYCAGMGVDYLSFPISSVDPKTFKDITGWVSGPKFGIEISVGEGIKSYQADFVVKQIQFLDEEVEQHPLIVQLSPSDLPSMRDRLILHKNQILFLEISSTNISLLQQSINELKEDFKIFVRLNGNLEDYLNLPVDGLSLVGNAEERPGLKEYPIADVLERLEIPG